MYDRPQTNELEIADVHSMPFGALAAAHAFLHCGEAIKAIGRCKLLLVMTNFFDDFTVLACKGNSKHVGLVVSFLFRKLGWDVAQDEKKHAQGTHLEEAGRALWGQSSSE